MLADWIEGMGMELSGNARALQERTAVLLQEQAQAAQVCFSINACTHVVVRVNSHIHAYVFAHITQTPMRLRTCVGAQRVREECTCGLTCKQTDMQTQAVARDSKYASGVEDFLTLHIADYLSSVCSEKTGRTTDVFE